MICGRKLALLLFVVFSVFATKASHGDLVTYEFSGILDGGPGALYPTNGSPNFNDNGIFSLQVTFEESQGTGGVYSISSGVFTINGVYFGTLDATANTLKVTPGSSDIFEISSVASEAGGTVVAANFTGDEVWHKDGGSDKSTSNTGATGPDDRYFEFILEDNTGTVLGGSDEIPEDLDQLAWTDSEIRIQWRKSSKISVKGIVTSIQQIPEPSAFAILSALVVAGGYCVRRRRPKQQR